MHQSSMDKMFSFRDRYLGGFDNRPLLICDLGSCDINGSYRKVFDDPAWTYVGLDLAPGKNVDVVLGNPYKWRPIKSDSVDVLVSGQAFEHMEFYWVAMLEVSRVLKPGGVCCIVAPSGGVEHRFPVDCWRFFPDGFRALGRFARLIVLEARTQWEPDSRFSDLSNMWRDSVLVCRKPRRRFAKRILFRLWRFAIHEILLYSLPKPVTGNN